ncbi:MAG: 1-acyl-sn-glycerol-3-phosphate acyltransferase [Luteibaculaceae bacterium]
MEKFIAYWVLRAMGWKLTGELPPFKKAVICVAPHTSNWDYFYGRIAIWAFGFSPKILIKKESFKPPLGWLLKALGGLPVNRGGHSSLVKQIAQEFNKHEKFTVIFTPEGTRKYNPAWKRGFYFLALEAKVPILISFLDYKKKELGFIGYMHPTGNVEKDILELKTIYVNIKGKYPENGVLPEELVITKTNN